MPPQKKKRPNKESQNNIPCAMHLSVIVDDTCTLMEKCCGQFSGCLCAKMHCLLCPVERCSPKSTSLMELHQRKAHRRHAIQVKDLVILVCYLNCEKVSGAHYHCPECGIAGSRQNLMEEHIMRCIPSQESGSEDPVSEHPSSPLSKTKCSANQTCKPERPAKHRKKSAHMMESQTTTKKTVKQCVEADKVQIQVEEKDVTCSETNREEKREAVMYGHVSVVDQLSDLPVERCTTCCDKFHCPLCTPKHYKPAFQTQVRNHLRIGHWKYSVSFRGCYILKCCLPCLENTKSSWVHSHWHCPLCPVLKLTRARLEEHLAAHEAGRRRRGRKPADRSSLTKTAPDDYVVNGDTSDQDNEDDTAFGKDENRKTNLFVEKMDIKKPAEVFEVVAAVLKDEIVQVIDGCQEVFLRQLEEGTGVQFQKAGQDRCLLQGHWSEVAMAKTVLERICEGLPLTEDQILATVKDILPKNQVPAGDRTSPLDERQTGHGIRTQDSDGSICAMTEPQGEFADTLTSDEDVSENADVRSEASFGDEEKRVSYDHFSSVVDENNAEIAVGDIKNCNAKNVTEKQNICTADSLTSFVSSVSVEQLEKSYSVVADEFEQACGLTFQNSINETIKREPEPGEPNCLILDDESRQDEVNDIPSSGQGDRSLQLMTNTNNAEVVNGSCAENTPSGVARSLKSCNKNGSRTSLQTKNKSSQSAQDTVLAVSSKSNPRHNRADVRSYRGVKRTGDKGHSNHRKRKPRPINMGATGHGDSDALECTEDEQVSIDNRIVESLSSAHADNHSSDIVKSSVNDPFKSCLESSTGSEETYVIRVIDKQSKKPRENLDDFKSIFLPKPLDRTCPVCKTNLKQRTKLLLHFLKTDCLAKSNDFENFPVQLANQARVLTEFSGTTCPDCDKKFHREEDCKVHYALRICAFKVKVLKNVDPDLPIDYSTGMYKCRHCTFQAVQPRKVTLHEERFHHAKKYQCSYCDRKYGSTAILRQHERFIHETGTLPTVCEICGLEVTRRYIKKHMKEWHDPTYVPPIKREASVPLECSQCSYRTSNAVLLKRHTERRHSVKDKVCDVCQQSFALLCDLKQHKKLYHCIKPPPGREEVHCPACNKTMLRQNLELHIRHVHKKIKEFVCPICSKAFQTKWTLNCHMTLHQKPSERKYKFVCSYCGSGYNNKTIYNDHLNVHTGNRPYKCEFCRKSFKQISVYRKHIEIHNSSSLDCSICGQRSLSKTHLFNHMRQCHQLAPLSLSCLCGAQFTSLLELNAHQAQCTVAVETISIVDPGESPADLTLGGADDTTCQSEASLDTVFVVQTEQEAIAANDDGLLFVQGNEKSDVTLSTERMFMQATPLDNDDFATHPTVLQIINENESDAMKYLNKGMDVQMEIQRESAEMDTIESSFQCGYCKELFPGLQDIQEHMVSAHATELQNGDSEEVHFALHMEGETDTVDN